MFNCRKRGCLGTRYQSVIAEAIFWVCVLIWCRRNMEPWMFIKFELPTILIETRRIGHQTS